MLENIKTKNKIKGNFGENIVCKYLDKYGYDILERNFNCMQGEIDVIFKDEKEIVFAEIKTRTNVNYGFPAESVNFYKKRHILNASRYYAYINHLLNKSLRFDVIEVYITKDKPIINHIKNAFY